MVSERDSGGQQLLPLPDSWPVAPDEVFLGSSKVRLRGTADWAPLRPTHMQFMLHPKKRF